MSRLILIYVFLKLKSFTPSQKAAKTLSLFFTSFWYSNHLWKLSLSLFFIHMWKLTHTDTHMRRTANFFLPFFSLSWIKEQLEVEVSTRVIIHAQCPTRLLAIQKSFCDLPSLSFFFTSFMDTNHLVESPVKTLSLTLFLLVSCTQITCEDSLYSFIKQRTTNSFLFFSSLESKNKLELRFWQES